MKHEVNLKPPRTFDKQIEILRSRNIIINDKERARKILSTVNYYRLTGYALHIKNGQSYIKGYTIESIFGIYSFDKRMRNILMDVLEAVEISMRTSIAYVLGHKYGPDWYIYSDNFKTGDNNKKYHKKFLEELEREKRNNKRKLFIEHHINNYYGILPIWVATKIMTFGMLSRLYANLKTEDISKIANSFIGVNHKVVESWLRSLSILRNICAHYGRLYNRKFNLVPAIHKDLSNYKIEKNKLFANVVAIKYLLPYKDELDRLIIDLNEAIQKWARFIDLRLIGFPENWIEILSK